jgi:hypothetical protein
MMNEHFSREQQSIITGSLLGDGHLSNPRKGNSSLNKCQCLKHLEYLEWHKDQFEGHTTDIKIYDNYANGKKYKKCNLHWRAHPYFSLLRKKWYPVGKKIVPSDLQLDPLSIAVWYFDDGYNSLENRTIKIATCSFQVPEIEFLIAQLNQFDIKCRIAPRNFLYVYSECYKTFIDLVKPYMNWPCFDHKIQYRESQLRFVKEDDIPKVVEWYKSGKTLKWIANEVNTSLSSISAILNGKRRKFEGISSSSVALNNKSGYTGVCWDKSRNKWAASLKIDGKTKNVGRFLTKEEAHSALCEFRNLHHEKKY